MKKNLPGIYKGQVDKEINKKVYYSWQKNDDKRSHNPSSTIENLFASSSYIFNTKVIIKTKDETYQTRIAGRMGNNIITFDNNVIPIQKIIDIQVLNK